MKTFKVGPQWSGLALNDQRSCLVEKSPTKESMCCLGFIEYQTGTPLSAMAYIGYPSIVNRFDKDCNQILPPSIIPAKAEKMLAYINDFTFEKLKRDKFTRFAMHESAHSTSAKERGMWFNIAISLEEKINSLGETTKEGKIELLNIVLAHFDMQIEYDASYVVNFEGVKVA